MHPHPPGAFVVEPSFIVPGFPQLDDQNLPPCVEQKIFFDALDKGRDALLRAEEQMERDEQARYQPYSEQDMKRACSSCHGCRSADEVEHAKLREEDLRKAEATRRRAEKEVLTRLIEKDKRKAWEAHCRAMEQERQRQAEQEAMERKRREQEERQRQAEQEAKEHRERERRKREAALSSLITPLRVYENRWAELRSSNTVDVGPLRFHDIPWPSFDQVRSVEDLTEERILAFVSQLHEHIQGPGGGHAKSLRSEMLRWHPDKFDGQVLEKVIESDRDAVRNGAGHISRILNAFISRMR